MDFMKPVLHTGNPWDLDAFRRQVVEEQQGALAYLDSDPHPEWHVPTAASDKVWPDGRFKPYFGDTVVALLAPEAISALADLQSVLIEAAGEGLSDPLLSDSFHITIHDLTNGREEASLRDKLEANDRTVVELFDRLASALRQEPALAHVKLTASMIFPCMNTSVLVGFVPATERDFRILMSTHKLFDEVVALNYWFRPHVTLAYFKPKHLELASVKRLANILRRLNPPALEIRLDLNALVYQRFTDMNSYQSISTVAVQQ